MRPIGGTGPARVRTAGCRTSGDAGVRGADLNVAVLRETDWSQAKLDGADTTTAILKGPMPIHNR